MNIINCSRGTGKTSMLVATARVTGMPIIVRTHANKEHVIDVAHKMDVKDHIMVYTIEEWQKIPHHNEEVLLDNMEIFLGEILSKYLNANVVAGTMTIPMDGEKELEEKHKRIEEIFK